MSARNGQIESPIESITVAGFKSIVDETTIAIKPLTILAGANSSGKSSMIQPLLMLKQTLEAPYDPGPLLINGPNVKFTKVEQFFSKESSQTITIAYRLKNSLAFSCILGRGKSTPLELRQVVYDFGNENVCFRDFGNRVTYTGPKMKSRSIVQNMFPGKIDDYCGERDRFFYHLTHRNITGIKISTTQVIDRLHGVVHVEGIRGNPLRNYPRVTIGNYFPGTFDSYAASIIASYEYTDLYNQLLYDFRSLGLTSTIQTVAIDDATIEIRVGRFPNFSRSDTVSISDVGFGVSQSLPVVVALLVAKPNQFVYIEQPELHLHPKAQYAMAKLIARAAKRGVRVVIETHSSLLLLGIQECVALGELSGSDVALHWFNRDPNTGQTSVDSRELDSAGRFGEWPVDFDDTMLMAQMNYLNASQKKLATP
jgi:predicted ATPase